MVQIDLLFFEVKFRFYLPDCYSYFWRIQLSFYYLCFSLFVRKSRFVFVIHCFKYFTSIFLYSSSEWSNVFFWKPVGSLCSHRNVWSLGGGSAFPETSFHHRCYRGMLSSRIGDINPRHGVLILLVIGVVRVVFLIADVNSLDTLPRQKCCHPILFWASMGVVLCYDFSVLVVLW